MTFWNTDHQGPLCSRSPWPALGDAVWLHTGGWIRRWRRRRRRKTPLWAALSLFLSLSRSPLGFFFSADVRLHQAGGMETAGGFNAGKAGHIAFDPVAFFTHPRTILRLMSWVRFICSVSVFINGGACVAPPSLLPSSAAHSHSRTVVLCPSQTSLMEPCIGPR